MKRPNGKKEYKWYFQLTMLSFGYSTTEFEWGYGHITVWKNYAFLFWSLSISQPFIKY